MDKNYVRVLKESLCRKKEVLQELLSLTMKQKELLEADSIDWDAFDHTIDDKSVQIAELERLDEGFDMIFEKVKGILQEQSEEYRDDIAMMQRLIRDITACSTSLEAAELRNKARLEERTMVSRRELRQIRRSATVASNYYKNNQQLNLVDPQLMDRKK